MARTRFAAAFVAVAAVVCGVSGATAGATTPIFDSSKIFAYGGTGNPGGIGMAASVAGKMAQSISPSAVLVESFAPNQFRFDTGMSDKTYGASRDEAARLMMQTVEATPHERKTLAVYSQTGDAARIAARALVAKGFPADQIMIVAQGDPGRQGSTKGIAQVLRSFQIPILGVDFDEDQSTSGVKVVSVCNVGVNADPICAMPDSLDPITAANAAAGFITSHPYYGGDLDLSRSTVSVHGDEIDIDVPTDTPSLVLLARGAGIDVPQEWSDALSDYLTTDHGFPKLEEVLHGDFLPELAEGLLQPKDPVAVPALPIASSPGEIPAAIGEFTEDTTIYVAEQGGAAIGGALGGAIGSNFGAGGAALGNKIGTRVGQVIGREVGEEAAPVVADIATGVFESVQTGNPQTAIDAINRALPYGVPPIQLP